VNTSEGHYTNVELFYEKRVARNREVIMKDSEELNVMFASPFHWQTLRCFTVFVSKHKNER
jgi:hypothetical protein